MLEFQSAFSICTKETGLRLSYSNFLFAENRRKREFIKKIFPLFSGKDIFYFEKSPLLCYS